MTIIEKMRVKPKSGFTIIELVVVMAIVALLATIVILSYNGWRGSVVTNQVKSDLSQAAAAMHSAVTFTNTYPASIPDTFKESNDVDLELAEHTDTTFCIDGTSEQIDTIIYHVDQTYTNGGELQSGLCIDRPADSPPEVPTGLAITSTGVSAIGLSWTASPGIVSKYTLQCAQDAGFIYSLRQATSTATTGTVSGVDKTTTVFCRVRAENSAGNSSWSTIVTTASGDYQPPTNIVASNRTMSSLVLSWTVDVDNVNSYAAQCAKDTGYTQGLLSSSTTGLSTTFNSMDFNTTYYCRVRTTPSGDPSAWSGNLVTSTVSTYGSLPIATSIEGYWTTAPTGYLLEDGSAISRTQYSDLFAVIGTTYGAGNGSTTFNLPDSRGRTPVNKNSADAEFATVGQNFGTKVETLTINQLPAHSHDLYMKNSGTVTYGEIAKGDFSATGSPTGVQGPVLSAGGGGSHNNIQPSIVKSFAIKYTTADSSAASLNAGTSMHGYWSSAPAGMLLEDGSAVSRTTYADLFAAIGTTYGAGNGSTTFNLPDSRGRATVNKNSADTEFDTMGEKYGEKTHLLTIAEMPAHTHPIRVKNPGSATYGEVGGGDSSSGTGVTASGVIQSAGGGNSHNEIQPSIVQQYAIKFTAASGSSPVGVGTSVDGYWAAAPSGYLVEDGSAVSRSTYSALFAVIGTTHGAGNGSTTFNLPDSRGRVGVNKNSGDTEFDTMGEKYGEKTHLLTIAEMPAHTHPIRVKNAGTGTSGEAGGGDYSATGSSPSGPVVSAGGGLSHNNIQPSIVKLTVIRY